MKTKTAAQIGAQYARIKAYDNDRNRDRVTAATDTALRYLGKMWQFMPYAVRNNYPPANKPTRPEHFTALEAWNNTPVPCEIYAK